MLTTIRQLHRMVVDRIAESGWLRGRSGANASWAHYQRHARAGARADTRHAGAREQARTLARRGQPRVLTSVQEAFARVVGSGVDHERPGK